MKKGLVFAATLIATTAAAAYCAFKALTHAEEPEEEVTFVEIKDDEEEETETAEESEETDRFSKQTKDIGALYPYLPLDFVNEMLLNNAQLNSLFEKGTTLTITHKAKFDTEAMANTFVQILEEKSFSAVLEDTTVKAVHNCVMENERIVSDIFNVANQVNCLGGDYLGYHVEEA